MRARWALGLVLVVAACDGETNHVAGPPPITAPVEACDVSILMPMPPAPERLSLLGPNEEGSHGPLLPAGLYADLPQLELFTDNAETYELLRVVALRLDPCFPTLDRADAPGCKSVVRLVMQPVRLVAVDDELALEAVDAAVHLFYSVDEDKLEALLARLVDARIQAVGAGAGATLGVHPALAQGGLGSPFMMTLRRQVLETLGADNLTRVTVMALGDFSNVWTFAGFDVKDGALQPIDVSTLPAVSQKFTNVDATGATFSNTKLVPPGTVENIDLLLDSATAATADPAALAAAYEASVRIENPAIYNPDTIDCATCHIAPATRRWAEAELDFDASALDFEYRGSDGKPVPGATGSRTDELRMFGYFDERPSISQRVVNETDALVSFWNGELGLN